MTTYRHTGTTATGRALLDSKVFNPDALGDQYMQAASDGGYVVNDETYVRNLITGLVGINQWSCFGLLLCGGVGYKDFGTAQPKLLSMRGPNNTPATITSSPTVGTASGKPYIGIPDSGCFFRYSMPVRVGPKMGAVLQDLAGDTGVSAGLGLRWTADGTVHDFYVGDGGFFVYPGTPGGQEEVRGPSTFAFAAADVASWDIDFDAAVVNLAKNGTAPGKSATFPASHTLAGVTQTIDLCAIDGANRRLGVAGIAIGPCDRNAIGALVASL